MTTETTTMPTETTTMPTETTTMPTETTNIATETANISTKTMDVSKTYKGTIVKYINQRNFGFIKISNIEKTARKEIFFHKSNIIKNNFKPEIQPGDKCQFEVSPGNYFYFNIFYKLLFTKGIKGDTATNIVINYRPIPKINKIKKTNNTTDENNAQAALFTKTMLDFFRAAATASK
ncbi:unnamed protein product [Rotaria sp. Silwood2]|nr:unnamed protein product [Rotaria sp. Silwood2]CAF3231390.1 unnamed protein product [Rotaria sp. Silwood2]CAF3300613.1 unnamed protein product [Rotaria sp. Silwood2]